VIESHWPLAARVSDFPGRRTITMSDFKILTREAPPVSVLEIKGYLDAHTAPELENAIDRLVKEKKYNIIVNCKDLTYISSAGLGVFMAYIEEVRKNQGDIKLSNMSPKIFNVFDLLGFPLLYEIFKDESEAVKKFVDRK
jgi:anti-sigma B factor antagonist